jgi:hypothetical protein
MKISALAAVLLVASGTASVASAIVVNFDDVPSGTIISNQYPEALFSFGAGVVGEALGFGGVSPPNILCAAGPSGRLCVDDIFVDFPQPVNNLTFLAVEPNEFGTVARVRVFTSGLFNSEVPIIGLAGSAGTFVSGNRFMDLSAFTNVTRIEILSPVGLTEQDSAYGGNGIGYDNFSFDVVPTPGVLALVGMGAVISAGRRRK